MALFHPPLGVSITHQGSTRGGPNHHGSLPWRRPGSPRFWAGRHVGRERFFRPVHGESEIRCKKTKEKKTGWWLSHVEPTPLKNDGVRQLG